MARAVATRGNTLAPVMVLALALTGFAAPAGPAPEAPTAPAGRPASVTPQQRQQIQQLVRVVLDSARETPAVLAAVRDLAALGDPARLALRDALRALLARDRSAIERGVAAVGDPAKLAEFSRRVDELRQSARENIAKLAHDETIKIAHENYKKLTAALVTLNVADEARLPVLEAAARRAELLKAYREAAPANDASFKEADEAKLLDKARKVLGLSPSEAAGVPALDDAGPRGAPADPAARAIWFYRACRQIEHYNAPLADTLGHDEAVNVKFVNQYREALGILPYEIDARLVQSARRHSKEMVDLKYFSHESPTPSERDFGARERNAGYGHPTGENIAYGPAGGEEVFWLWFDSPGHHKNMAAEHSTALGVGRWHTHWTQNMGGGPRLMLRDEAERKAAAVKGTTLPPDTTGPSSPSPSHRPG